MRRNPFEELEDMLERMSKQVEEGMAGGVGTTSVAVDVRDQGDAYVVTADLPGYEADDVDLTLSGKRLELSADRDVEYGTASGDEDEGEGGTGTVDYVRRERRRSAVTRTVRLPEEVDPEGVEADLEDGVLTVHLPKAHAGEGHRIEIDDA